MKNTSQDSVKEKTGEQKSGEGEPSVSVGLWGRAEGWGGGGIKGRFFPLFSHAATSQWQQLTSPSVNSLLRSCQQDAPIEKQFARWALFIEVPPGQQGSMKLGGGGSQNRVREHRI